MGDSKRSKMKYTTVILFCVISSAVAFPFSGGWLGKEKHHEAHPITEPLGFDCPYDGNFALEVGANCSRFYWDCSDGISCLKSCTSGSFDESTGRCSLPSSTYCDDVDVCGSNVTECSTSYFHCFKDHTAKLEFCLYGDVFDSYANNCVGLRNTYCPQDINLYTYPDTNCNAATTTKPPPTTQPSTEPTVKTTPVAPFDDFVCPNGGNELFPRPGHCTQFYLCEDGFPVKTYIFNCPHGSEFGPSKKQCVVGGHFDC